MKNPTCEAVRWEAEGAVPRGRRYELVSVCEIWQWRRHSCLLSPRAFFGVLVYVCGNWRRKRLFRFLSPKADFGVSFSMERGLGHVQCSRGQAGTLQVCPVWVPTSRSRRWRY
jgi:hypothetical protein